MLGNSAEALREKSGGTFALKLAVMVWSALEVNVQVPVPKQPPPLHPAKFDPEAAVAVSVTEVPSGKVATQFMVGVFGTSQSIPAGLLATMPLPEPAIIAISCGSRKNVAVTCLSETMSRMQGPVPVHAPLHPVKCAPGGTTALRVTEVPPAKAAEHGVLFMSQLMPAGLLVTLPSPVMLLTCTSALNGPADDPPVRVC